MLVSRRIDLDRPGLSSLLFKQLHDHHLYICFSHIFSPRLPRFGLEVIVFRSVKLSFQSLIFAKTAGLH